jgi:hypothetical protein
LSTMRRSRQDGVHSSRGAVMKNEEKLSAAKQSYKTALEQLPKLQKEHEEISEQRREAQRKGDIINAKKLANGAVALREMVSEQHDLIAEYETTVKQLETDIAYQANCEQLVILAEQADETYQAAIARRKALGQAIQEALPGILELQQKLSQSQQEAYCLLAPLGFRKESQKDALEHFLGDLGIAESAFRYQRLPYQHWTEITLPVEEIPFASQIASALNFATGARPNNDVVGLATGSENLAKMGEADVVAREAYRKSVIEQAKAKVAQ